MQFFKSDKIFRVRHKSVTKTQYIYQYTADTYSYVSDKCVMAA